MTGIGRTLAEQVSFMRERAVELMQELVLLQKRMELSAQQPARPRGMALIRAANALDATVSEYRELAEKRRNGTREGDEQATQRHLYAEDCAEVAAWLRALVREAGPGL